MIPGLEWGALNPAQRAAAEHLHGPILVVAGAGSGKTRVLTARIALLIRDHGVPPGRIFAVTFTNKAAAEMRGRVAAALGGDPPGLWIGTFHALSARLLRREAERLGFTRHFTIFDEDDRTALLGRVMEERGLSTRLFPPRAVQQVISAAKNRMQTAEELLASAPFDPLVQVAASLLEPLARALQGQNAMDFDDLMLHPLRLCREHPDRLEAWQHRFDFLLVDEFQDTNRAQYELVRLLGAHRNVFAVGDDDQSIYGWRGAEVRNMRDFQQDFAPVTVVRLEENYRSTPVVLETANAVIRENTNRLGKTLRSRRRGGEPVTVVAAADERDEAEWLALEFARRVRAGDWSYGDIAVLYRTNAQSRAFEEALRKAGIPYRLVGAVSFYERREVKDLLAYLRLVANPADDEAFLRAITVPRRGLGDTSLAQLHEASQAWQRPLLATAEIADRIAGMRPHARAAFRSFADLVMELRRTSAERPPALVLEDLIRRLDYEQLLLAEGIGGAERWDNVRELVAAVAAASEVVEEEDGDETSPLERFLAHAALLTGQDVVEGPEGGITLMTVHTAKGLEWPVVAVAGLEDGLFPLARSLEQADTAEEERRLCYVALTRAKDKLYLSWARSRRRGGEMRSGMPSRFLRVLPPTVVEERSTSSLWAPPRVRETGRRRWIGAFEAGLRWGGGGGGGGAGDDVETHDAPRYVKGERVRHRRFGSGTIEGLVGAGRHLKVTVRFDDAEVGRKQLLVQYAGLERAWEEG